MSGPRVAGWPTVTGAMDDWGESTVPFTTPSVEGMASELALYLAVAQQIAGHAHGVVVSVEPDWDGRRGRWLAIFPTAGGFIAELCAVARIDPGALDAPTDLGLAEPILHAQGWSLFDDGMGFGYWHRALPADPERAAEVALLPALALFAVYEPARWYVMVGFFRDASMQARASLPVDLRGVRRELGLPGPPTRVAPSGTEPWALLCEAGFHDRHEPPCWVPGDL